MQDIIKKLKFKGTGTVINAPKSLEIEFENAGLKTAFEKNAKSANTLVFINDKQEYLDFLKEQLANIETDSVLWFAYPKGTSKIKTNINRDIINAAGTDFGITAVSIVSIDATWSALRFRPIDKVGK